MKWVLCRNIKRSVHKHLSVYCILQQFTRTLAFVLLCLPHVYNKTHCLTMKVIGRIPVSHRSHYQYGPSPSFKVTICFQAIITGDFLSAWEHRKERPTLYFEVEQPDHVVSFLFSVIREMPRARQLTDWVAFIFDVLLPEVWHDCFVYIHLLILALCFILYILVFHITPHTW